MRKSREYPIWPAAPVTATRTGGRAASVLGIMAGSCYLVRDSAR